MTKKVKTLTVDDDGMEDGYIHISSEGQIDETSTLCGYLPGVDMSPIKSRNAADVTCPQCIRAAVAIYEAIGSEQNYKTLKGSR